MPVLGRIRFLIVFALIGCFTVAAPARADLTLEAVGDPIDGASWLHAFRVTADSAFSELTILVSDSALLSNEDAPAMAFPSDASWSQKSGSAGFGPVGILPGSSYAAAAGDATTDLMWVSHFDDPQSDVDNPAAFAMSVFARDASSNTVFYGATATWDGIDTWTYSAVPAMTWAELEGAIAGAAPTPVPPATLLGMLGLGLVGTIARRRR